MPTRGQTTFRGTAILGLCVALAGVVAVEPPPVPGADGWRAAEPGYAWSFPADHWPHPDYRTEWWYLTGLLSAEDGARYGYQFTLFRVGLTRTPLGTASAWHAGQLVMGHAALTEIDAGRHRFAETLHRAAPMLAGLGVEPDPRLAWVRAPAGTDGRWSVGWNGSGFEISMRDVAGGFGFDLTTRTDRAPLLQGDAGFSRKSADGGSASQYYSFTRLETRGTLVVDGRELDVLGTSWMDKEFSTSHLAEDQVGWDWFSLRLDDGRDLMVYRLRRADGTTSYASATLVDPSGSERSRQLTSGEWTIEAIERWTTPDGTVDYPVAWRVSIPSSRLELVVRPFLADSENVSSGRVGLRYWEGAVRVEDAAGTRVGEGYVELTGYGDGNRPPV